MKTIVKFKIADITIQMQSEFELEQLNEKELREAKPERFNNFLYTGANEGKSDIIIDINIVDNFPEESGTEDIFITYHPEGHNENWRLQRKNGNYIYICPLENKKQVMLVNRSFDRVAAYLHPKRDKGRVWNTNDIIYDFLQVILINYLALHNEGIFTHSIGVKDNDGKGLLFAGKSGAGKSTTARIWHKYSKAMVLNDDRVIVRRLNGKFFIYGSPWHGEFSDYLDSHLESAALEKLFFIYHAPENCFGRVLGKEAFNLLYTALFPPFWDKEYLENVVSFTHDLVTKVPCFNLGFLNNEKVIEFVRKI